MPSSISLMMNGMQQFADANGVPFLGGKVHMYVPPATTTPKVTWQDMDRIAQNPDPIILDAAGRCVIWGEGIYRQILLDMNDNVIWDKITVSVTSIDDVIQIISDELVSYYDQPVYIQDLPAASETMWIFDVVRASRLEAGLPASKWSLEVPPSDEDWIVTLYQNVTAIGTVTFAQTTGNVSIVFASDVDLTPGDQVKVVAPTPQDSTAAFLAWTLIFKIL